MGRFLKGFLTGVVSTAAAGAIALAALTNSLYPDRALDIGPLRVSRVEQSRERAYPTPTPQRIELQRPTAAVTLQSTPTPTPTATVAPVASINFVEVYASSCKRKINLYNYSRTMHPKREGWDLVNGELRVFNQCYGDYVDTDGEIIFGDAISVEVSGIRDRTFMLSPSVFFYATWEGGGKQRLQFDTKKVKPREEIVVGSTIRTTKPYVKTNTIPNVVYTIPFSFEIPQVVTSFNLSIEPGKLYGRVSFSEYYGSYYGSLRSGPAQIKSVIESFFDERAPQIREEDLRPLSDVVVKGRFDTSMSTDPDAYEDWFRREISSFVVNKQFSITDEELALSGHINVDNKVSMEINITNNSSTRDNPVYVPELVYVLSNNGIPLDIKNSSEKQISFIPERSTLPPGYSTTAKLEFPLEILPQSTRYIVFSYLNTPLILDLGK